MFQFFFGQSKFLNRRKNYFAAFSLEHIPQLIYRFSMLHIAHKRFRINKLIVKLVVKVSPIYLNHKGWIFKFRLPSENSHKKRHRKRFPRSRRMPDHSDSLIIFGATSGQRFFDRDFHGKKLMILGSLFRDLFIRHLKQNEITNKRKQTLFLE